MRLTQLSHLHSQALHPALISAQAFREMLTDYLTRHIRVEKTLVLVQALDEAPVNADEKVA
ncbi:transcriptional regulator ngg1 [Moniliophthora roreri]|nr:transcriptional regulator ngg1 [Moniliophthora roreri]